MATNQPRQERIGAAMLSFASVVVAGLEWLDRPEPGELVETGPDWYVTFQLALHGIILLLLLVALTRLGRMTADRPSLRGPFLVVILVGIAGAAYVVGRDLGLV